MLPNSSSSELVPARESDSWTMTVPASVLASNSDFKEFLKKIKEEKDVRVVIFTNSPLKSPYSTLLLATLRKCHHVEALDLSSNTLSTPSEVDIIDFLRVR